MRHPRVVLYGAPDCGLCARARAALADEAARLGFEWLEVDIAGDDDLERRYRIDIPVVEVDGVAVCRYRLEPDLLEAALAQAGGCG